MQATKLALWQLLLIVLGITGLSTGCRDRGVYHDPYYHDDHPVTSEQPYYNRWEQDTHRSHEDLSKRNQDEQKQYWDWRHNQH